MATTKKIEKKQPLNIEYDSSADVLYISFGKPKPAVCVEVNEGDLVRFDVYTDKIVGITIIDFKKKYMKSRRSNIKDEATKLVPIILEQVKH